MIPFVKTVNLTGKGIDIICFKCKNSKQLDKIFVVVCKGGEHRESISH